MNGERLIEEFIKEISCIYRGETFLARDNGSILRLPKDAKRPRQLDNKWTFGLPNQKTGYPEIASIPVHRIIATGFLGEAPSKLHVVDHIDTNKRNNRPENLRWVTRLENILLNPITIKRIEQTCGCSVEQFLNNPSKFRNKFIEPSFKWMSEVNVEEARNSLQRLLTWARTDKKVSGGSLGEWVYKRDLLSHQEFEPFDDELEDTPSKTPSAVQRDWETPSEFPCCPLTIENALLDYSKKLKEGEIFCKNEIYSSLIIKSVLMPDHQKIFVLSESTKGMAAIKPWSLAEIIYEKEKYVHIALGNFFTFEGAEKELCLAQGLEWSGEDTFDDYC